MKPERLSIEGELFEDLRRQINLALESCLAKMRETGMSEGYVSVKIPIEILGSEYAVGADRRMDTLKIEGKVGMTVPMKYEGKINTKTGLKCVSSDEGYMIAENQISMDEILEDNDEI